MLVSRTVKCITFPLQKLISVGINIFDMDTSYLEENTIESCICSAKPLCASVAVC